MTCVSWKYRYHRYASGMGKVCYSTRRGEGRSGAHEQGGARKHIYFIHILLKVEGNSRSKNLYFSVESQGIHPGCRKARHCSTRVSLHVYHSVWTASLECGNIRKKYIGTSSFLPDILMCAHRMGKHGLTVFCVLVPGQSSVRLGTGKWGFLLART